MRKLTEEDVSFEMRKLNKEDVTFEFAIESEMVPIEGNYMHTDDHAYNERAEEGLLRRLQNGDDSAWCVLLVTAKWKNFTGTESIGFYVFPENLSYPKQLEYAKNDIANLQVKALENINNNIANVFNELSELF